jgi:hydroxysqualene dehydroxylase
MDSLSDPHFVKEVAVVGAGWAGLSASYRLAKLGHCVTLYESAPQAGGRARGLSLSLLGQTRELDNGQHLLIGAYTETQRLLCEVLSSESDPRPNHRQVPFLLREAQAPNTRSDGHADPVQPQGLRFGRVAGADQSTWLSWLPQAGTALGLLSAQGLGLKDKMAFARLMSTLKRADYLGFEGSTVLKFLQGSEQPASLIARVWEPLCVSALNTGVDQACAQTFVNVLQDSLGAAPIRMLESKGQTTKTLYPSDYIIPNQDLTKYFVAPLVAAFQKLGGRLQLRQTVRSLSDINAQRIVLAIPPYAASALLDDTQSDLRRRLCQFDYQSITTVYLAWDRALPQLDGPPLLLTEEPTKGAFGQWLFDRGFENRVHVAAVVVSARGRYANLDTDTLSANIAHQVHRQTGLPLAQTWRAINEKRATFTCTPDRPKLSEAEMNFIQPSQPSKQIFLAGDYCYPRYPATLESAVRSGLEAAARVHLSLNSSGQKP